MRDDLQSNTIERSSALFSSSALIPLDSTQEVIFPPALKVQVLPADVNKKDLENIIIYFCS